MIKANELRRGNFFDGMGMAQTVFEIIDNTNRGEIKVLTKQPNGRHPAYFVSEQHKEQYEVVITCIENRNQYKPCEIEGITLTKKWCKALGFKKWKDRFCIEAWASGHPSQRFDIDFKDGKIIMNSRYQEHSDELVMGHIKFVHQLQNLYFCLTGKELTIIQ